jgi:hypothetical protein
MILSAVMITVVNVARCKVTRDTVAEPFEKNNCHIKHNLKKGKLCFFRAQFFISTRNT